MRRELFGMEINQKSKSGFFSATDLVRAGDVWRRLNGKKDFNMSAWLKTKSTLDFIKEIEDKYNKSFYRSNRITWVHPLLFIDMALAISPKLKIETYEWLFDNLIKNRNDSGSSYKLMCGSLYVRHGDKKTYTEYIKKLALRIKLRCSVENWEDADESKLKKRDEIHKDIAWLSDSLNNNNEAVRMALLR